MGGTMALSAHSAGETMIERIYVHNYRCFENFTLDLTGRGSVLVIGKNGSGKSTLRYALSVFRNICRGRNRVREWISQSDFAQHRTDLPMRFEVDLTLTKKRFQYVIAFEYPDGFHEARILDEKLTVNGDVVFSRQRNQVSLQNGPTFGLDWHVAALPIINEKQGGPIQQLKAFFASLILLSPVPGSMSGFAEEESFEVLETAENFASWLSALLVRYPARYSAIAKYLQFVIPDFASFEFIPRGERGKQLRIQFEDLEPGTGGPPPLTLDFKQLSDGEKCFFLSALVVASNRPENPVFCFWDEPDNHLSLSEVSHFVTELRRMTNNGGQFLATSHHPEAIRRFSDENTVVFTRNSHLEPTRVRPLSEIECHGDLINAILLGEVIA